MIRIIKDIVFTIFHPSFWIMNSSYNRDYDEIMNVIINSHASVKQKSDCNIIIGPFTIWTSNYPYSYGIMIVNDTIRPSRRTVKKLKSYIDKEIIHSYFRS